MKLVRNLVFFLSIVFIIIVCYYNYLSINREFSEKVQPTKTDAKEFIKERNGIKYILYWTKMFDRRDFYYGLGKKPFENCEFKNCFATDSKDMMDIKKFDALIFHGPLYSYKFDGIPWKRYPHQRYVFANLESPETYSINLEQFEGFYNWTMTYRMDSDVPNPYGYYVKSKTNYTPPSRDDLRKRKKLVAWFVSKCDVSSQRHKLVEKMKKHIEIDIFGRCGYLACTGPDCYHYLEQNYKFYLSFENSYCKDYYTEKLLNIHNISVVPIVYGRVDYKNIAPFHSFINVEHFSSVKKLVDYLKFLNENDEKYLEYFHWKHNYYVVSSFKDLICNLCKKLNTDNVPKVYNNLRKWWEGDENAPYCLKNMDLPSIVLNNN